MQGVILNSIDTAASFIRRTRTSQGLTVVVEKARAIYRKAQAASARFLERFPIVFDDHRPELNYYATSQAY